jgi:hypothetical protein
MIIAKAYNYREQTNRDRRLYRALFIPWQLEQRISAHCRPPRRQQVKHQSWITAKRGNSFSLDAIICLSIP